jgi:heat-inducible transcriptional repressor
MPACRSGRHLLANEKEQIIKEYKSQIKKLEDVLEKTSRVISQITHYAGIVSLLEWQDKIFYKGMSLIIEQPEFQNLDKMRILIKIIEDKERLLNIINRDFDEKVKVYIGDELEYPEMNSCSLVVSSYRRKNRTLGRLAVLGPMRMEYRHIISSLEYISDVLSQALDTI